MPEAASVTSLDPVVLVSSVFRRLKFWTLDDYGIHAAARLRSGFSRIPFRLVMPAGRAPIPVPVRDSHPDRDRDCPRAIPLSGRRDLRRRGRPYRAGSRASRHDKCQSFDTRRHCLCRVANQTCCISNIFTASLSQRKLAHPVLFQGTTAASRKSSAKVRINDRDP